MFTYHQYFSYLRNIPFHFGKKPTPSTGRATCSWLTGVHASWKCIDNWEESSRRLRAYDTDDESKYVQLNISTNATNHRCLTPPLPIGLFISPSPSGTGLPTMCFSQEGFVFKTTWSQDAIDFNYVGKNVSLQDYFSNLRGKAMNYADYGLEWIDQNDLLPI